MRVEIRFKLARGADVEEPPSKYNLFASLYMTSITKAHSDKAIEQIVDGLG